MTNVLIHDFNLLIISIRAALLINIYWLFCQVVNQRSIKGALKEIR